MTQSKSGRGRATSVNQPRNAPIKAKLKWEEDVAATLPIIQADQAFIRYVDQTGQITLTLGHAETPLEVVASPETIKRIENEGVPVTPTVRLGLTPKVLKAFVRQFNTIIDGLENVTIERKGLKP